MAVVVLPTPPFWLAIAITLPIVIFFGGVKVAIKAISIRRRALF
jgi:hypothetical protein